MGASCRQKPRKGRRKKTNIKASSGAQIATNYAASDGSLQRYQAKGALGRAKSDFLMDIGAIPEDNQYKARLPIRKEAAQIALQEHQERRRRDRRRARQTDDDTTDTTTTETTTSDDDTTNTNTTALDENTDTELTNVENISEQTFDNTENISNYFDDAATSVNTAAAQQQNQASALTTSVGEAEDDAISYMTTGTGSNILTSAQGLLGDDDEDEDDPFNRRQTLIGA